jgi:replication initiation protein RepC
MTLALIEAQFETTAREVGCVDKWRIFRDICTAKTRLGLGDRALTVLNALLSFFPQAGLSDDCSLIVFPSNRQLSARAHGIAGTTLRRQLNALVDARLINRKDSPNGKRYAHRTRRGDIEDAFGFDLTALAVRASEFAALAQEVEEERRRFRRLKETVTLYRRDIRKIVAAALDEGVEGNWKTYEIQYSSIVVKLPRKPTIHQLEMVADELQLLREKIVNTLKTQFRTHKMDGKDSQNECHIQNSKSDVFSESEPRSEIEPDAIVLTGRTPHAIEMRVYPLDMVLRACPQISAFGSNGKIAHWRDLMSAAVVVRSMFGVSPSAYQEACEVMGPENAATTIACMLERAGHINSAGGYLRDLTRKAACGEFSVGRMLMALI